MLSFGEEAEEEEKVLAAVKQKIKSSHDVLNDPRLLKEENPNKELVIMPYSLYAVYDKIKLQYDPWLKGRNTTTTKILDKRA